VSSALVRCGSPFIFTFMMRNTPLIGPMERLSAPPLNPSQRDAKLSCHIAPATSLYRCFEGTSPRPGFLWI